MRDSRSASVAEAYALVPTSIGTCGLAWNDIGLTRIQLPEASAADTETRLRRRGASPSAAAPRDDIAACIDRLIAYFHGHRVDFGDVPIDTSALGAFDADVCLALRGIGWGRTTTYGALAASVGAPDAARAVGVTMSRNAWPIIVPCHRVLAARGAMGGFSAYGGTMTKQMLLTLEGNGLDMLPLFAPEQ